MTKSSQIYVEVKTSSLSGFSRTLVATSIIILVLTAIVHWIYADRGSAGAFLNKDSVAYFISLFNLSSENTVASWYASMLLLYCGVLGFVAFALDTGKKVAAGPAVFRYGWLIIAAIFVGLSLDELGSIHENAGNWSAFDIAGDRSWQSVLAIPLFMVLVFMVAFAWQRLRHSTTTVLLFFAGAMLLLSVPLQEYVEMNMWSSAGFSESWRRPVLFVLLEEGAEIAATLSFIFAIVSYIRLVAPEKVTINIPWPAFLYYTASLTAMAFLCQVLLFRYGAALRSDEGVAINWFPSAAAFVVFLYARLFSEERSRLLPLFFLVFSVYYAINFYMLMQWDEIPALRLFFALVVATGVGYVFYRLRAHRINVGVRMLVYVWATVVLTSLFVAHALSALAALPAFALFFVVYMRGFFFMPGATKPS